MKKRLFKLYPLACAILLTGAMLGTNSCKKTNPNAAFVGTYAGTTRNTSSGNTSADTLVITTGASSDAIVILEKASGAVGNATVSGGTITIPTQNVAVNGGTYPMSGSGALAGSTLTINWTETFVQGINTNFVFTGTKQ
jgi:hypothetical protein